MTPIHDGNGDSIHTRLPPQGMIFMIMEGNKMAGSVWSYDGHSQVAILLHRTPATLTNMSPPLARGNFINAPVEKDDLNEILLQWGMHNATQFIIEGGTKIRVLAVFNL